MQIVRYPASLLPGPGLTIAKILYPFPDHRSLLQIYLWQEDDVAPDFPNLRQFLKSWRDNNEVPIQFLEIDHLPYLTRRELRMVAAKNILTLH